MDRRALIIVLIVGALVALLCSFLPRKSHDTPSHPVALSQDVYVWQRSWTPAVQSAVRERGTKFGEIIPLLAEVAWKNGEAKPTHVKLDYEALRATHKSIGVALRIDALENSIKGNPFDPASAQSQAVCDIAADLVDRFKAESITPAELQIDFDCPESKLTGYAQWIDAVRARIAPIHVSITTLPSWMNSPAFAALVGKCDSYVLQVHSLQRPTSPDQIPPLCDVAHSQAWANHAASIGVPFKIALPTYSYVAAFDAKGKFLRLAAEGSNLQAPSGGCVQEIHADAGAIAELVRDWSENPPAHCIGVIWYRLPNDDDELNWRWPTLCAVMQGRTPQAKLVAQAKESQPNLFEIELRNDGDADAAIDCQVEAQCASAKILAADALGGFERLNNQLDDSKSRVTLRASAQPAQSLGPGDRKTVGWVRTSQDTEVRADVSPLP